MTKDIWILSALTMLVVLFSVAVHAEVLDEKKYVGENGIIGENGSEKDEIQFSNGKFYSVGCGKYGFGDADYSTKVDGDRIFFTADIYSTKYGRITYSGVVQSENLEATFMWFDKGKYWKPEQVKWWKGTLK